MPDRYITLTLRDLEEILYRHDPLGLAKMGAPPDEYSPEASEIYDCLHNGLGAIETTRDTIYDIFNRMFDRHAGTPQTYEKIAEEIYRSTHVTKS